MRLQIILALSLVLSSLVSAQVDAAEPQVAHIVFWTLAEDSPENRAALIADAKKYLSGHDGTVYFSVGAIAGDMNRSVNDREFHVSMNLIFTNRKAHDVYNVHTRHEEFKKRNAEMVAKVRVFDSYVMPQPK